MKIKLQHIWYRIKSSFWFIPTLMGSAAIILSFTTTAFDRLYLYPQSFQPWWIYSGGQDGARTLLSTIAGSMITVAGVVFSITIVVLSLASQQFGPRLVRNLINIKANQVVLGTFVATFIYNVLVMRSVGNSSEGGFVPHFSVTVAVLTSLASLGVLIYFIHSVSESIQAQNIIARVRRDLDNAVDRIFPEKLGREEAREDGPISRQYDIPSTCDRTVCQVTATKSGYLQALDGEALMRLAVENDLLIHLGHRPGDFVTEGSVLITVWPGDRVDEALARKANDIFIFGPERTLEQDVEYAISLLVEIAVRALSPGINDPNTAKTCLNWLGTALSQLAHRRLPSSHRYDENNRLRVISKTFTFEGMVDASFNTIRQNAYAIPTVSIHLLDTLGTIASQIYRPKDREVLLAQAKMVLDGCIGKLEAERDRKDIEERYQAAVKALEGPVPGEKDGTAPSGPDRPGA